MYMQYILTLAMNLNESLSWYDDVISCIDDIITCIVKIVRHVTGIEMRCRDMLQLPKEESFLRESVDS